MKMSNFLDRIIGILMLLSYLIIISIFVFLSQITTTLGEHVFVDSTFFSGGSKFTILNLEFNNVAYFYIFNFFFFLNSVVYYVNTAIISPLFNKLIFTYNDDMKISSRSKTFLTSLLFVFDLWSAFRSLLSIIGITSNIYFFISNTVGFLVGDIMIKYLYIQYPSKFIYDYSSVSEPRGPEERTFIRRFVKMPNFWKSRINPVGGPMRLEEMTNKSLLTGSTIFREHHILEDHHLDESHHMPTAVRLSRGYVTNT